MEKKSVGSNKKNETHKTKQTIEINNRYNILTNETEDDDVEQNKVIVKKVRRGRRRKLHVIPQCAATVKLFSTNGAGIVRGKQQSLRNEVMNTQANIVTVQETHATQKGKINIPNFITFEAIRKKKGGGTMISVHEDLEPKLIE